MKIINILSKIKSKILRDDAYKISLLNSKPRYESGVLKLKSTSIHYNDGPSLYEQYRQIFINEIYAFPNYKDSNYIIDCGANIGTSVLFFIKNCPHAKIIAFEPNPEIYRTLKKNTEKLDNVEIKSSAVWSYDGQIEINVDLADASSITSNIQGSKKITVESERLLPYLDKQVDFLKIDVEGAELEILKDIKDKLHNIKNIFIEYHATDLKNTSFIEIINILHTSGFEFILNPEQKITSPYKNISEPINNPYYYQICIFAFK